jgi:TetR/AcrR family transcriptional regulator of autoinduction and epiphytic fitness
VGADKGKKKVDGRRARTVRTRKAMVEATLDLLAEGDLRPTAATVSERAGISVRSVFQHFADLDDLFLAVADQQAARVARLYQPIEWSGPLADRVATFVSRRAKMFEVVSPVRRATQLHEHGSAALRTRMKLVRGLQRAEVEAAFEPEFLAAREAGRRELPHAVAAVACWEYWEVLRAHHGLSTRRAVASLETALLALLNSK